MTQITQVQMQIGKNGLNAGFFETIQNSFKHNVMVKVNVLRSASRNKAEVKKMADEIVARLGENYTYRFIGFTIVVKKFKKKVR